MSTSISILVDNLSNRLHSKKCTDYKSSLQYMRVKDNLLICKCLICNKDYNKDFNKELINRFSSTFKFCNRDFIKRKGVYPYKYMDC